MNGPLGIIKQKEMKNDKGRKGGPKIGKMGRRHLWMVPNGKCKISLIEEFVQMFASVLFGS